MLFKLLQKTAISQLPPWEQFGFIAVACYVRDVRQRAPVVLCGPYIQLCARLVRFFLTRAGKTSAPLNLAETVVQFFKATKGVGNRKSFLPQKVANVRLLHGKGLSKVRTKFNQQSKVRSPKSTAQQKKVPRLQQSDGLRNLTNVPGKMIAHSSCSKVLVRPNFDIPGLTLGRMLQFVAQFVDGSVKEVIVGKGACWKIDPDQKLGKKGGNTNKGNYACI